jgi:hypothetical protein
MADRARKVRSPRRAPPRAPGTPLPDRPARVTEALRLQLRMIVPISGVIAASIAGFFGGVSLTLIVLAAAALLIAILQIWGSLQLVAGDASESVEQSLALFVPQTEIEQKQAVLRALKDLDFERSMGKITEQDYRELRDRYRAQAKQMLLAQDQQLDPFRAQAELLVVQYLKQHGVAVTTKLPAAASTSQGLPANGPASPDINKSIEPSDGCGSCGTRNDADAAFCKRCGHKLPNLGSPKGASSP